MKSIDPSPVPGFEEDHSSEMQISQSDFEEKVLEKSFLIKNLHRITDPLAELIELDALEIYLVDNRTGIMDRVFRTGQLKSIWEQPEVPSGHPFMRKQMEKNEIRIINLPNSRVTELVQSLREKAFGQVACLPILAAGIPAGMLCVVHTRRSMLDQGEQDMLSSLAAWIGDILFYEKKNQQVRAEIITQERERIGMDLHDGIIQSLYGIGLSMENARLNLTQGTGEALEMVENSLGALQSAIADIRAYILDLRPRQLRHENLFEGMRSLIREFRANTMVDVELEGQPKDVQGMAREQVDALFHIFQEAISNTAKHAKATQVSVRIWRRDGRVMLRISDNGQGFDITKPDRRIGQGLANMRARAEGAGGGMEIVSIRKQGTTLLAWVPVTQAS